MLAPPLTSLTEHHAVAENVHTESHEEERDKVLGVVLEATSDVAALCVV